MLKFKMNTIFKYEFLNKSESISFSNFFVSRNSLAKYKTFFRNKSGVGNQPFFQLVQLLFLILLWPRKSKFLQFFEYFDERLGLGPIGFHEAQTLISDTIKAKALHLISNSL